MGAGQREIAIELATGTHANPEISKDEIDDEIDAPPVARALGDEELVFDRERRGGVDSAGALVAEVGSLQA